MDIMEKHHVNRHVNMIISDFLNLDFISNSGNIETLKVVINELDQKEKEPSGIFVI